VSVGSGPSNLAAPSVPILANGAPALAEQTLLANDSPATTGAAPAKSKAVPELELAGRWLEALRSGNAEKLAAQSVFPVEFRDTGEEGRCDARRSAADPTALAHDVACLAQDELLMALFRAKPGAPPVEVLPDGFLEPWAKQWRSEAPIGARPILSYYDRSDAWLSLILWVDSRGVRAVWKTGTDVRAEVAVAGKWRVALRNRDVEALTRLASYPFELRDEGLNAHCKKGQTAKRPEEMPGALRCVLGDKVLSRALHDSPDSTFEAERREPRVPGAFPDWWRKKDHEGLWPVWTLTGTKAGYEFDLTLLIAKDGVRAFWKRGSFVEP
jgi:hypothetical protein